MDFSSEKVVKKSKEITKILMALNLSDKIVDCMIQNGTISSDDKEIYLYGVNQGLFMLLSVVTFMIVGLITGTFVYILAFLFAVMMLRSFAGGYHASTPLRCYTLSSVVVCLVVFLYSHIQFNYCIMAGLLVAIGIFIILLSPVDSTNKRLDELETKVYKRRSAKICIVEVIIALVFIPVGIRFVTVGIFWALVIILLLQLLEILTGSKERDEQDEQVSQCTEAHTSSQLEVSQ